MKKASLMLSEAAIEKPIGRKNYFQSTTSKTGPLYNPSYQCHICIRNLTTREDTSTEHCSEIVFKRYTPVLRLAYTIDERSRHS